MAKSGIIGLVALIGIGVGLYVFWNPKICKPLTDMTGGKFNFCDIGGTHDDSAPSPEPGVLTGGKHPHHRHPHVKKASESVTEVPTTAPILIRSTKHPHIIHPHHVEPVILTGGKHPHVRQRHIQNPDGTTTVVSVNATPAKASLGYASDFRMSI